MVGPGFILIRVSETARIIFSGGLNHSGLAEPMIKAPETDVGFSRCSDVPDAINEEKDKGGRRI